MAKKGLGRGLDVFYGDYAPEVSINTEAVKPSADGITELRLMDIEPNANQPRYIFDDEKIQELADSIKEHGVITPILVIKSDNGYYKIIAGERRWRAAKKAGIKTIPAIIKDYDNEKLYEVSLIENLQRQDLNIVEEAQGYKRLMTEFKLTQEQVAQKVSKSRSQIANSIRILNLDPKVLEFLSMDKISLGHAKVLLGAPEETQLALARNVIENQLTVRELERLIKKRDKKEPSEITDINLKLAFDDIEEKISNALHTKVKISKKGDKGKITIDYYSTGDLERLIKILSKAK